MLLLLDYYWHEDFKTVLQDFFSPLVTNKIQQNCEGMKIILSPFFNHTQSLPDQTNTLEKEHPTEI